MVCQLSTKVFFFISNSLTLIPLDTQYSITGNGRNPYEFTDMSLYMYAESLLP